MIRSMLALLGCLSLGAVANAADYLDGPLPPEAPGCDDPRALDYIAGRFAWAESHTWNTGLEIAAFENVAFQTHRVHERPGLIDRTYCKAQALISDGNREPVYYVIAYPLGFAGYGNGVEFCLPHYDRWHVYGASCRSVKP